MTGKVIGATASDRHSTVPPSVDTGPPTSAGASGHVNVVSVYPGKGQAGTIGIKILPGIGAFTASIGASVSRGSRSKNIATNILDHREGSRGNCISQTLHCATIGDTGPPTSAGAVVMSML